MTMITPQKVESRIPKGLKYFGIIVVALVSVWLCLRLETGVVNPFYTVTTDSMDPNLNDGDLMVINHNIPFNQLKVGDIILFHGLVESVADDEYGTVISRIANIDIETNPTHTGQDKINITTRSDSWGPNIVSANSMKEGEYIGKIVYVIPGAGSVIKATGPPIMLFVLVAASVGIVFYYPNKKKRKEMTRMQQGIVATLLVVAGLVALIAFGILAITALGII